ncbi:hypothetical protein MVEN_00238500 [Mycena venus]|uniref:Uncharacterized protein n=1 Tax=Mycena venus TaxID=2733690 RepID=A0A8H6YZ09_9AGAR|nr:hypothetical protein MVEN_00238500 [Mycena venus]
MPWSPISDGIPDEVLRQFALGLNEVLSTLCATGVLEKYAFAGDMAHRFLATATQGRNGAYHYHTPLPPTLQDIPHPTNPRGSIKALTLACKLELKDPTERGCGAFENGLENIASSSRDPEDGDDSHWYHARRASMYGHIFPGASIYTFRRPLGPKHVFHVLWDTDFYPPWAVTQLPYPANAYIRWATIVPLIVDPFLEKPATASPDTAFFRGVLAQSKDKGKSRAKN